MKIQQTAIALAILGLTGISVPASAAGDNTAMTSASSASTMRSGNAQTRQVQQALKDKGYDPGPVDGVMGSRTREALKQYQKSQNLTGSSGLDSKTLDSLGVRTAAATGNMGNTGNTPTAGGNSAEPEESGRPAPTGAARSSSATGGSSTPNPTAGGNSAEPDKSGRPASAGASKGGTGASTPNPTAGGNSTEPDKSGRAK